MLEKLEALITELGELDRQERIELLIDLARNLPPLPDHLAQFKDEAHRVPECQSPVFLFPERQGDSFILHADVPPEAPTVRGFMAVMVEGLSGAPLPDVLAMPTDILERSGLRELLGMQRASGLHGVLRRIHGMAAHLTAEAASDTSSNTSPTPEATMSTENPAPETAPVSFDQDTLVAALRTVIDPELHVNIVDLGLVYTIASREDQVDVEMTLTSPACPAGPQLLRDATNALEKVEGVAKANVKLVMNPPWTTERMTDEARDELGIF